MASPKGVWTREATGLVREMSTVDSIFFNYGGTFNFWIFAILVFAPIYFPRANIPLAMVLAMIGLMSLAATYAGLTSVMPRSGGEYVFISRGLNPLLGFLAGWGIMWAYYVWFAFNAIDFTWRTSVALDFLGLPGAAVALQESQLAFVVGTVFIIVSALVLMRGLGLYRRIQFFVIMCVLVSLVAQIVVFGLLRTSDFVRLFNAWALTYMPNSADPYMDIIKTATSAGFKTWTGTDMAATLGVMVFVIGGGSSVMMSTYCAGEQKGAAILRNQFISMCTATAIALGSYAVISWVVLNALGYDFVGAIGYIYATRPDLYPFALPPWYYFFLRVITDNPIVLFLGLFGTYLSILLLVMMDMIINTRYVFAWSFDRLLPAALADVSDRFHAPLKSILLTLVIGEIMYAGILFYGWSSFVSTAIFWMIVSFLVVAVTAILFPFRRKEIYNLSPLKAWNLRKIPVISLIGTACLVYLLIHVYYFYAYPDFAAFFGALTPSTGASTLVLYAAGVAIFYTARWYRAKQGIDISLIFREIPPE